MTGSDLLLRQVNVRLTVEEFDEIAAHATAEMRKPANMARLLLREALVARKAQVQDTGPDRPKSGERRRLVR